MRSIATSRATGDRETLRLLLPTLSSIVEHHVRGTRFGIGVDPGDGLLRQGAAGYQLTWMDAKVGDWVVTPRRGKAVEINALWYNALRLLEGWVREEQGSEAAAPLATRAAEVRTAFNARFWYAEGGYLYDVVDGESGDDPACRPNQLFAISLSHPVLAEARWASVLEVVRDRLLTPLGLRTLAPDHPDYKATYDGDLRARDAAYHQGTVWPWLVGPFVDAWLRARPGDRASARALLEGLWTHLDEACVGSISEIFDAEPPFTPRGCISQGWSVAEALRALILTAEPGPAPRTRRQGMTQTVSRVFGIVFLLVGLLGLVSTPFSMSGGLLLGLFPVNVLHNLVHLAFGAWGLGAARTRGGAAAYCRIAGIAYLILTVVGTPRADRVRARASGRSRHLAPRGPRRHSDGRRVPR